MAVNFYNGYIADTPATPADGVRVSVPNLTVAERVVYGPLPWDPEVSPAGIVIGPSRGDTALIAVDDDNLGKQWIVDWTGARTLGLVVNSPNTPINGVGIPGSKRAGRILTLADFVTLLGVNAPNALYQLDGLNDVSGNGRTLTNTTAAVTFDGVGPTGLPNTAAVFTGNAAMGLFLADASGGPFNPRTVSCGCWFAILKRGGTSCRLMAKGDNTVGTRSWYISVSTTNVAQWQVCADGTNQALLIGVTDIADGRWHFAVGTYDGEQARLYIDGSLDSQGTHGGSLFQGTMPFNIGIQSLAAVGGSGTSPMIGRIASAFVTPDVLSDDQVRLLYAAKVSHGLSTTPDEVLVSVRRYRRGKALASADFTAAPVSVVAPRRLYSLNTAAVIDAGADAANLTATGGPIAVAGPDGVAGAAVYLAGGMYYTAITPTCFSGTNTRSAGCWFAVAGVVSNRTLIALSSAGGGTDMRMLYVDSSGLLSCYDGANILQWGGRNIGDGRWHFGASVWDNAAADGIKRKLYLDGKCVAGDANFPSTNVTGGSLLIGRRGVAPFEELLGLVANVFVCDYVLAPENIQALYALGSRSLPPSPFDRGEIIEAMDATNLYVIGDQLEPQYQIDFKVRSA